MKDLRQYIKTTIREFIVEQELNDKRVNAEFMEFLEQSTISKIGERERKR